MHGLSAILPAFCDVLHFKKFNFSAKTSLLLGIVDLYYSIKGQGGNVPMLHLVEMREIFA